MSTQLNDTPNQLTKQELLQISERSGQRIRFLMPVEFDELVSNRGGIALLNDMVDQFVKNGYLLEDLNYTPVKMEKDTIFVEVDAYAAEWIKK